MDSEQLCLFLILLRRPSWYGKAFISILFDIPGLKLSYREGRCTLIKRRDEQIADYSPLGPIFDAYDVRVLVIPGNIGIVVSMMLIGLCKGQYIHLI